MEAWIGVDLDGTLAEYHTWEGWDQIGPPIPAMVARVREWIAAGIDVRIFTARIAEASILPIDGCTPETLPDWHAKIQQVIERWCLEHLGKALSITATKDYGMIELWDDRCVQVISNLGLTLEEYATFTQIVRQQMTARVAES